MRMVAVLSAFLPLVLLTASGCGSGGSQEAAAAGVGVQVDPPSALVEPSATVAFRATVTGTATTSVSWSVDCGSITQGGVFTAPQTNGTCRVTATSPASGVSGSALVSVGAGGWAATCAAEPEPTTNVVYACDCQAGADSNCVAGSDSNPGTKAQPYRTWGKVAAAFRALPAGGTVALCKGGRWSGDVDTGGAAGSWLNSNCTAGARCTVRDYTPSWGGTNKPTIVFATDKNAIELGWGNQFHGHRFLNLYLLKAGGGANGGGSVGVRANEFATDLEVCNCTIDGFNMGAYIGATGDCPNNVMLRGNRIINSCTHGMLVSLSNSDIDGNYFDNNGNSAGYPACGYDLSNPSGGTNHTIYASGGSCNPVNMRVINNEVHRNAVYQGYTQGSPLVFATGGYNVTYENNLIDMTPVHPTNGGGAIFGGNDTAGYPGLNNFVVRRNRILAGRGRQIGLSSFVNGVIEDNVITVTVPSGDAVIAVPHGQATVQSTSAVVRNNTINVTGSAPTGFNGIFVAGPSAADGNVVTGNSVTFAAGGSGTCFRADTPSKLSVMDNNQCSGASNFATNNSAWYSLAEWRAATSFDTNSITP